ATVTLTVDAVNDAPVAVNDFATTVEDVPVSIPALANDSDPDGDTLTIISVSPANGTASISGTNVLFTPAPIFYGPATIGYRLSDPTRRSSDLATVTLTADAVNDAPVAVNDSATTVEDVPVTIPALANDSDPDGDTLTITSVSPANGT